jgi:hypothetical protein
MYFRRILLILSIAAAARCARENEPASPPIPFDPKAGAECFTDVAQKLKDYSDGKLEPAEIAAFWDCTSNAVREYQRLTSGDAPDGSYTPEGMRHFIEHYFLQGRTVSDPLLHQVMQLKRVLVAGTDQRITRAELDRALGLLDELKAMTVDLQPHTAVLFQKRAQATDDEVSAANSSLQAAAGRLGRWLDSNRQPYAFADLVQLIQEMQTFNGSSYENLIKAAVLAPSLKRLLVSGQSAAIGAGDWGAVLRAAAGVYSSLLHEQYTFKQDMSSGLLRADVPHALDDLSAVLGQAIAAHKDGIVPVQEWQELFTQIEKTGWLPDNVKPGALMDAWSWLAVRIFQGGNAGLTAAQNARLARFSQVWKDLYAHIEDPSLPSTAEVLSFQHVRESSPPLEWDTQGRMNFPFHGAGEWTRDAQRRMAWPFAVINLLRLAYGGENAVTVTSDQVSVGVRELVPVLQKFGWLLTTKLTVGPRRTREADLFTYASNGDGLVDMNEATRYLAFIMSSFRVSQLWLASADANCAGREAACVRAQALQDPDILSSLPRLQKWQSAQKPGAFIKYFNQAEKTILGQVKTGEYAVADMVMVMMLLHYAETFLERFDADMSESANLSEAMAAYPLYGPTLLHFLGPMGLPEDQVQAFFTFMMRYGDIPFDPDLLGGQVLWLNWKWNPHKWALDANRPILMGILEQLSKF